jgi:peptide/nickel transport system substrate-binding protein
VNAVSFRLKSKRTACLAGAAALVLSAAAACSSSPSSSGNVSPTGSAVASQPTVKTGGSITVLESSGYSGAWTTLDPAQNKEGAATQDFMTAIYGQLFELGTGGKIVPDLATSYTISPDSKTITIHLRQGVTFSDGTAFNAAAVVYNWMRDLGPIGIKAGLAPAWDVATQPAPPAKKGAPPGPPPQEPVLASAFSTPDPYTVVVHQTIANAAFIDQLFDAIPMWIASPTALKNSNFGQNPVGAGPFIVASNVPNSQLVVKANPHYWQKGFPLLSTITFKTVGSDEAAYEALLANQGQVYENMSTTQLITESAQHFTVENNLGTSPYDLQLNTAVAPFNNAKARQAIYAATNFAPILQHLFGGRYPVVEGFTGPGGICYQQTVPGYQGYNPTLAKQLIQQSGLNKVTIQLGTIALSTAQEAMQALATQWEALGLKVKLSSWPLSGLIAAFVANGGKNWQSMVQTAGAYDPAAAIGVNFRFNSHSPFSGVHDPKLDNLLAEAQASAVMGTRCGFYNQAAEYIAKNYYGPFYFAFSPANISVKGVGGPGISTPLASVAVVPTIPWEDIYYNPSSS